MLIEAPEWEPIALESVVVGHDKYSYCIAEKSFW